MQGIDVIERLRRIQELEGAPDQEFGRRLNIDRETWRKLRLGKSQPSIETLRGIAAAFPHLRADVRRFILPETDALVSHIDTLESNRGKGE